MTNSDFNHFWHAYWSFVCFLWRNSYSGFCPCFKMGHLSLIVNSKYSLHVQHKFLIRHVWSASNSSHSVDCVFIFPVASYEAHAHTIHLWWNPAYLSFHVATYAFGFPEIIAWPTYPNIYLSCIPRALLFLGVSLCFILNGWCCTGSHLHYMLMPVISTTPHEHTIPSPIPNILIKTQMITNLWIYVCPLNYIPSIHSSILCQQYAVFITRAF